MLIAFPDKEITGWGIREGRGVCKGYSPPGMLSAGARGPVSLWLLCKRGRQGNDPQLLVRAARAEVITAGLMSSCIDLYRFWMLHPWHCPPLGGIPTRPLSEPFPTEKTDNGF